MNFPLWFVLILQYPILTLFLIAVCIVGAVFGIYKLIKK